jgi:hypothetical protein
MREPGGQWVSDSTAATAVESGRPIPVTGHQA